MIICKHGHEKAHCNQCLNDEPRRKRGAPRRSNSARVTKAETALVPYQERGNASDSEALTDLLTDLRHYAAARDLDFHQELGRSYQHYLTENSEVPRG